MSTIISNIIITAAGFIIFAFLHSLLAQQSTKQKVFSLWPRVKPVYTIGYTLTSVFTLGLWYFLSPFPDGILYEIPFPGNLLFNTVQLAGLVGFLLSLKTINLMKFIGVSHIKSKSKRDKEELVTDGIYGWVRHPLYTATMIILLFNPTMSCKLALINLLFGLYFWFGSIYEERNLIEKYGEAYEKYREKVPRFIPKIILF